jgi:DNA-binding protein HU-beta
MNKTDLAEQIASDSSVSKAEATRIVDLLIAKITSSLKRGDHVTLSGFGSFSTYQRQARNGRNPQTGALIKIATRRVAKFAPGVDLKRAVGRK